ncbi:DUF2158 domain-containing protein [Adhaeribacter aquaticus]|uniref:DUF2158 domain-containing protein n=1 Tax=Adhaeribacter aquaticus TaxID=299567 RepID=UPI00047C7093|nr:DUF2158 domain-containing protein [Adhaeribacter aquaticus]
MINTFKIGDMVTTKTGTQTMTVDFLTKNGEYNCKWHEEGVLREGEFKPDVLELKINKYRNSQGKDFNQH